MQGTEHVTVWMTNEEHAKLAQKKVRLRLTQSETVLLALRLMENASADDLAAQLEPLPNGKARLRDRQ